MGPEDRFERQNSFRERILFQSFADVEPNVCGLMVQNFSAGLSKRHSTCLLKLFLLNKNFFENFIDFSNHIPFLNWNIFDCFGKKIGWLSNLQSISPEEVFWEKQCFNERKILSSFLDFGRKTLGHSQNFSGCVSKLHDTNPEELFRKFFLRFGDPCCQFWTFRKMFWRFSETVYYERWGSSSKKTFFQKKCLFRIFFGVWANFFWILRTNCSRVAKMFFSEPRWTIWEKHCLTKINSFFFLRLWDKNI